MTIANLIVPTLEQFPAMDRGTVYDPDGTNSLPDGQSSSIPLPQRLSGVTAWLRSSRR